MELVVVDDGSDDGTPERLASICSEDPRVRVLGGGHHGVSHARNVGIDAARGEWVGFCDADDVMTPSAVEEMLGASGGSPIVAGAISFELVDGEGASLRSDIRSLGETAMIGRDALPGRFEEMWGSNLIQSSCAKLFSLELLNSAPGRLRFDEDLSSYEDLDFVLRCMERSCSFAFADVPCYRYLNRPGESNHSRYKPDMTDQMERVSEALLHFYESVLGDGSLGPEPHVRQLMVVAINNAAKSPDGYGQSVRMLRDVFGRQVFSLAARAGGAYPNSYAKLVLGLGRLGAFGAVYAVARARNAVRRRRAF